MSALKRKTNDSPRFLCLLYLQYKYPSLFIIVPPYLSSLLFHSIFFFFFVKDIQVPSNYPVIDSFKFGIRHFCLETITFNRDVFLAIFRTYFPSQFWLKWSNWLKMFKFSRVFSLMDQPIRRLSYKMSNWPFGQSDKLLETLRAVWLVSCVLFACMTKIYK